MRSTGAARTAPSSPSHRPGPKEMDVSGNTAMNPTELAASGVDLQIDARQRPHLAVGLLQPR